MKESFVFYKSWKEALQDVSDEIRLEVYDCIIEYALSGKVPSLKPMAKMAFNFIKNDLDRSSEKYQRTVERNKLNGSKGGRPKTLDNQPNTTTQPNPNNPVGFSITQPNPNEDDNGNEDDNDILLKKETKGGEVLNSEIEPDKIQEEIPSKKVALKKVSFRPPDPKEVQKYCDERQNGLNGQEFCDFYESKGWLIGKNKMKDWQAAVRTWEKYRKNENGRTNNGYNPNGKNNSGKVSGTQNLIDGIEYFEFT